MTHISGRKGRLRAGTQPEFRTIRPRMPRPALIVSGFFSVALVLTGCGGAATTGSTADKSASDASVHRESQSEELDTAVRQSPSAIQKEQDTAAPVQQNPVEQNPVDAKPTPAPDGKAASGSFASLQDACDAISAHMLSIAFAPLSYSYGGGIAEAKQAVSELPELRQRAPAGLRDDIARIEAVFAASDGDYSKVDSNAFARAMDPVEAWVDGNCPSL